MYHTNNPHSATFGWRGEDRSCLSDCSPKFQRRKYSITLKKLPIRLGVVRTKHKCKSNQFVKRGIWIAMDRVEALSVLHEILEVCKESVLMNSVSLDSSPTSSLSKGYVIKINCILDSASKQYIEPILKKHRLFLKESEGFVVIQRNIWIRGHILITNFVFKKPAHYLNSKFTF